MTEPILILTFHFTQEYITIVCKYLHILFRSSWRYKNENGLHTDFI
jgi:hypothetical protein